MKFVRKGVTIDEIINGTGQEITVNVIASGLLNKGEVRLTLVKQNRKTQQDKPKPTDTGKQKQNIERGKRPTMDGTIKSIDTFKPIKSIKETPLQRLSKVRNIYITMPDLAELFDFDVTKVDITFSEFYIKPNEHNCNDDDIFMSLMSLHWLKTSKQEYLGHVVAQIKEKGIFNLVEPTPATVACCKQWQTSMVIVAENENGYLNFSATASNGLSLGWIRKNHDSTPVQIGLPILSGTPASMSWPEHWHCWMSAPFFTGSKLAIIRPGESIDESVWSKWVNDRRRKVEVACIPHREINCFECNGMSIKKVDWKDQVSAITLNADNMPLDPAGVTIVSKTDILFGTYTEKLNTEMVTLADNLGLTIDTSTEYQTWEELCEMRERGQIRSAFIKYGPTLQEKKMMTTLKDISICHWNYKLGPSGNELLPKTLLDCTEEHSIRHGVELTTTGNVSLFEVNDDINNQTEGNEWVRGKGIVYGARYATEYFNDMFNQSDVARHAIRGLGGDYSTFVLLHLYLGHRVVVQTRSKVRLAETLASIGNNNLLNYIIKRIEGRVSRSRMMPKWINLCSDPFKTWCDYYYENQQLLFGANNPRGKVTSSEKASGIAMTKIKNRNTEIWVREEKRRLLNHYKMLGMQGEFQTTRNVCSLGSFDIRTYDQPEQRGQHNTDQTEYENNWFAESKTCYGPGRHFGKAKFIAGKSAPWQLDVHGTKLELVGAPSTVEWEKVFDAVDDKLAEISKEDRYNGILICVTANATSVIEKTPTINVCSFGRELDGEDIFNIPTSLTGYELANIRLVALCGGAGDRPVQIRNGAVIPFRTMVEAKCGYMANHSAYGIEVSSYTGNGNDLASMKRIIRECMGNASIRGLDEMIPNHMALIKDERITVSYVVPEVTQEAYFNGCTVRPALTVKDGSLVRHHEAGFEADRLGFNTLVMCEGKHRFQFVYGPNSGKCLFWGGDSFQKTIDVSHDDIFRMGFKNDARTMLKASTHHDFSGYVNQYVPQACIHQPEARILGSKGNIILHPQSHMHRCWERNCRNTNNLGIHGLNYEEVITLHENPDMVEAYEFVMGKLNYLAKNVPEHELMVISANQTYEFNNSFVINLTTTEERENQMVPKLGGVELRLKKVSGRSLAHLRLLILFIDIRRKIAMVNGSTIHKWETDIFEILSNMPSKFESYDWISVNQVVPSHFCAGGVGYSGILTKYEKNFKRITAKAAHVYGVEEAVLAKLMATQNALFLSTRRQLVFEWQMNTRLEAMDVAWVLENGGYSDVVKRDEESYGDRVKWYAGVLGFAINFDANGVHVNDGKTFKFERWVWNVKDGKTCDKLWKQYLLSE